MPSNADQFLPWLTGPFAALVLALIVIWGLWSLFREERKERRENFAVLQKVADGLEKVTNGTEKIVDALEELRRRRDR